MTSTLIILALLVIGAGIVIWAVRRKPDQPAAGPQETDTAWNDPVAPGEAPTPHDTLTQPVSPPTRPQDPRP